MSWTIKMFTDLGLPVLPDGDDNDLVRIKYKKELFLVRLSLYRISPMGIDITMTKKIVLLDKELPKYDWSTVNELYTIIRRSTTRNKRLCIRNNNGVPIGIK